MRFAYTWTTGRVRSSEIAAPGVRLIELEPADGVRRWTPGSHLQVAVTTGGRQELRHYSLVGDADPVTYRIAVRLRSDGLGGSAFMHGLQPGDEVRFTHPANHFELNFRARQYLLVAGGIGITPLVSMASMLRRVRADYRLLYLGRSEESMPFVTALRAEHGDRLRVHATAAGRPDLATLIAELDPGAELYLCGPLGLREDAARHWREAGRPAPNLRFETFASSGNYPPEPFAVHVADLGTTVVVDEHTSMLDALRDAGVEVMWDCLRGECGLCAVDVLEVEGVLDHRDVFLSEAQRASGRKLCTCVSRAVGGAITVDSGRRPDAVGAARAAASPEWRQ